MEPMEQQRLTLSQETGGTDAPPWREEEDAERRRASFQALIEGPYRREFEEAVNTRLASLAGTEEEPQEDAPQQTREDEALRRHFERLTREAEELKRVFPDFDLTRELRDPAFLRLTAPGTGVSVKDAFYALHGEDIQRESMRYAAQQAGRRIAASVRAGASRPVENGIQGPSPLVIGIDIRGLNKKQREEYRRRIHGGETINFRDRL